MRKLIAFIQSSLDGYVAGPNGELDWAHSSDPEFKAFVEGNAGAGGVLLFGRITYQMMESFWPTPLAMEIDPVVAERMNALEKVVFSRTLEKATWNNTRLVKGEMAEAIRAMKNTPGNDMAILGSGSIITQLAHKGLIDEYQVVVYPLALGSGRKMFDGLAGTLKLTRISTRTFNNGNVLLCYTPTA